MSRGERALPWLLPLAALLSNPRAALPDLSYYFRDFLLTFYPLRLFLARELREGRWPFWNPYLHEGTFALPTFYPVDLLLALRPSLELASWLLTLHLPLAALLMYALARELELPPRAAFAAGACYALGGLALSSLNLYVFLQALAVAPLLALALRRAALAGRRGVAGAALAIAVAVSTLAVEFVAQALAIGVALALEARRDAAALRRLLAALALGFALSALPVALIVGLLPETPRGEGFEAGISLSHALHPAALGQVLVAGLFADLDAPPMERFWGGGFFRDGFPYFVSLYLGPAVVALAVAGAGMIPRPRRLLLLLLAALALWFALGAWGGLAPALLSLPGFQAFRYPSKAFFTVHFIAALFAGAGAQALAEQRRLRTLLAVATGFLLVLGFAGAWALLRPGALAALYSLRLSDPRPFGAVVGAELWRTATVAGLVCLAGLAAHRGWLKAARSATLVVAVALLDLARAGAGLNPQIPAATLSPAPEIASLRLDSLDGHRVFSLEAEASPARRAFLAGGFRHGMAASFVMHRRVLGPYTNILDRVETAWGKDLTSFGGFAPELAPEDYSPQRLAAILPGLRQAAVSRILSLDPLDHPGLELLAEASAGVPGVSVRAYAVRDPLPRAHVACTVAVASAPAEAYARSLAPGFDAASSVALEGAATVDCSRGSARRVTFAPGLEAYDVEADGRALLVLRDTFARGWRATVDGAARPVVRANGKYRAVAVGPGRQRVELRYHPPGLGWGGALSGAAALLALWLLARPTAGGRSGALG